ncbi:MULTISPECIES: hypothetical protein [unclassified Streptomyces]|uniref:hypothetical protein n=1 Tax=unclassified Streptomyces TaxID=2593676 RepID=UPI003829AC70
MRSSAPVRTAARAVLTLLVPPLAVLALVVAQLLILTAPAHGRTPGPHTGADMPRLHAPAATAQHAGTGKRDCDQPAAAVGDAPRGRDRHRPCGHAPLPPQADRPSCAADAAADRVRAGPVPLPRRERPPTSRVLARLQVFRC